MSSHSPDQSRYFTGYNSGPGLSSVGSYQIAGTPYLSSSILAAGTQIEFTLPAVSKRIYIENYSGTPDTTLVLSFRDPTDTGVGTLGHTYTINSTGDISAAGGVGNNYIDLGVKCNSFFLSASAGAGSDPVTYSVVAELTGIAPSRMFVLSGSGINNV